MKMQFSEVSGFPPTILIHGLWLRSPVMWWLGGKLAASGFPIHYFNYSTTRICFEDSVKRLAQVIKAYDSQVNLVGHSLGGLLAVAAAAQAENGGKIVALGSPFQGSSAADWLARTPLGRPMLGKCRDLLRSRFEIPINPRWKVGVVAGTKTLGLGIITGTLSGPHDGTVQVAETKLTGADHVLVGTTHTNMIWSNPVRAQVEAFLKTGSFMPGTTS